MGTLATFAEYLDDRVRLLRTVAAELESLQSKYEMFFQEVSRVREREIGQIAALVGARRGKLPPELETAVAQAQASAEKELDKKLKGLEAEHAKRIEKAEAVRRVSVAEEAKIRQKNKDLDDREEALKAESGKLLQRIEEYNSQIREMSTGFGFFKNVFAMARMRSERETIESEQSAVAAKIEVLRAEWVRREAEHAAAEEKRRQEWQQATASAAAVRSAIDTLVAGRAEIVGRKTVEKALAGRSRALPQPAAGAACPRCRSPNPAEYHFCRICAKELGQDRPDLEGSIEELIELDGHHAAFAAGMKAGQEIIGLVRGLVTGLEAFAKSVAGMRDSQGRHSLATLRIDVPSGSVEFGKTFDEFAGIVRSDRATHPREFAAQVKRFVDQVCTETKIKRFFETMGKELSAQAKRQWR